MSNKLKSAYELVMEKMKQKNPALAESQISDEQRKRISEVRKIHQAKIAEKEIMMQSEITKVLSNVSPEQRPMRMNEIKEKFNSEIQKIKSDLEDQIGTIRKE